MILSATKIFAVLILLASFLYGTSLVAHKTKANAELMRKIVHCGLGLVCVTFPWVFHSSTELVFLCIGVFILLLGIRLQPRLKQIFGQGLYGVKRSSVGDLLFGIAVVLLFHYSQGNHALYVLPILILSFSDSAAALIGVRYGRHKFNVIGGAKSWEGCTAFFITTCLLSVITLYFLSTLPILHILLIALIIGLIGSMVEAVSWHGWDNLFVPFGLFLLLQSLSVRTSAQLLLAVCLIAAFILIARRLRSYSELNTHALLAALIAAYFFWETGGVNWLLPPLIVFTVHIILSCLQSKQDESSYRIDSIISIVAAGIFWIFLAQEKDLTSAYYLFVLSMAIHVQIITLLRMRQQRGCAAEIPLVVLTALLSGWLFLPALLLQYPLTLPHFIFYTFGFCIMAMGGIILQVNAQKTASSSRWLIQGIYAAIGSILGFIPIYIYSLWIHS